jgi:hypothetical protein
LARQARAVDRQAFHHPHHVVPRLGEGDFLDPLDHVEFARPRIAPFGHPAQRARRTGVVGGGDEDEVLAEGLDQLGEVALPIVAL